MYKRMILIVQNLQENSEIIQTEPMIRSTT